MSGKPKAMQPICPKCGKYPFQIVQHECSSKATTMTAADIINRIHERLDGSRLISVYGQTVEFKWKTHFFRIWINVADELEVRCIDPTYNYQIGEETEHSKQVKETLEP